MTDDLEGRIGPEDLMTPEGYPRSPELAKAAKALLDERREVVDEVKRYLGEDDGPAEAEEAPQGWEPTVGTVTLHFGPTHAVEGRLNAFSFGKGWLFSLDGVDEAKAIASAALYATYKDLVEVVVEVNGSKFKLSGELDFTIGYGFKGCAFTVSADEGSYVGE